MTEREKKLISKVKKNEKSHFNMLVYKLIKVFSGTKIDSLVEYNNIRSLINFYTLFFYAKEIEIIDIQAKSQDIIEIIDRIITLSSAMQIDREGIINDWLNDMLEYGSDIKKDLECFLKNPNDKLYYFEAMRNMRIYCSIHENDYNEWKTEIIKHDKGLKRATINSFVIFLLLLLALGKLTLNNQQYENIQEEKLEENDSSSSYIEDLDNIDVGMILERKL